MDKISHTDNPGDNRSSIWSWLRSVVLLTVGFFICPLYGDTNRLTNPGFENDTTGWTGRSCSISSVTTPVHEGTRSGRAYDREDTWQGIRQDMLGKMVIGETYTISGWVRTGSSAGSEVHITFQQTDGGNDGEPQYQWAASGTANNSEWTEISGSFTLNVTGTLTELFVYVEGPDAGIDLYVDDMVVYGPEPNPADPDAVGEININTRYQLLEGFGAAGAWYEDWITAHPQRETLYDIFFDELGLDIYRLRNTYDQGTNGADFMSRSGQIVAEAKERNPNLKILISSWSPPAYLKSNGQISGGDGATLIGGPSNYDYAGFAEWWANSITAWEGYGIDADYISIQNEPDYDASWDSCRFEPTETSNIAGYDIAFEMVYNEMYARFGLSMPKMLGPETTGLSRLNQYLSAIINRSHLYGYAHHLYNCSNGGSPGCGDEPDLYLTNMAATASQWNDKPLFQTEYEHATGVWPDAFNMALLLHNAFVVEGVSSYFYWALFWQEPSGLVSLPSYGSSDYTRTSDFYGFKHFSAFTDPGWQRVAASTDSPALRISAYISPDNQNVSVVIINTSTATDISTNLSFTGFNMNDGNIYRTRQSENCVHVGSYSGTAPLTIPAGSIVTLAMSVDSALTPPNPPQNLTAAAGDATVALDWDHNPETDMDGYNVYRSRAEGGPYDKLNTNLVMTSDYTDDTVANFISYYYAVTAVDTDGNESGYSDEASAMPNDGSFVQLLYTDFESGLGGWTDNPALDAWTRNSGATPTGNYFGTTGPDSGADDSTWYVFFETSSNYANSNGDTDMLTSPELDAYNRTLTFYYHMYGDDIGTLNVDVYDSVWHEAVWSLSGQQQTSGAEAYRQAAVDLSDYSGPIRIRFRAVAAGGYLGDIAVDDIEVTGSTISPFPYGDFTDDYLVSIDDLPGFVGAWLDNDCGAMDLNSDCRIGLYEFAAFARNWMLP